MFQSQSQAGDDSASSMQSNTHSSEASNLHETSDGQGSDLNNGTSDVTEMQKHKDVAEPVKAKAKRGRPPKNVEKEKLVTKDTKGGKAPESVGVTVAESEIMEAPKPKRGRPPRKSTETHNTADDNHDGREHERDHAQTRGPSPKSNHSAENKEIEANVNDELRDNSDQVVESPKRGRQQPSLHKDVNIDDGEKPKGKRGRPKRSENDTKGQKPDVKKTDESQIAKERSTKDDVCSEPPKSEEKPKRGRPPKSQESHADVEKTKPKRELPGESQVDKPEEMVQLGKTEKMCTEKQGNTVTEKPANAEKIKGKRGRPKKSIDSSSRMQEHDAEEAVNATESPKSKRGRQQAVEPDINKVEESLRHTVAKRESPRKSLVVQEVQSKSSTDSPKPKRGRPPKRKQPEEVAVQEGEGETAEETAAVNGNKLVQSESSKEDEMIEMALSNSRRLQVAPVLDPDVDDTCEGGNVDSTKKVPRKRGRPPTTKKTVAETAEGGIPEKTNAKRGRPPKSVNPSEPKAKRGRPPKAKQGVVANGKVEENEENPDAAYLSNDEDSHDEHQDNHNNQKGYVEDISGDETSKDPVPQKEAVQMDEQQQAVTCNGGANVIVTNETNGV